MSDLYNQFQNDRPDFVRRIYKLCAIKKRQ